MSLNFQPVEQFIHRLIDEGRAPAAGIAIAIEGKPAFSYLAGEARPGMPATESTLWPIASISKLYTASAIMSLIEEGRLALWSKASSVLPDFTGDGREEITLRQLLTHTAGLPDGSANKLELLQRGASWEQFDTRAFSDPLLFPPGTGQSYSSIGYGIAGRMAATVAGVSFPDLLRAQVFDRAGLAETELVLSEEWYQRAAHVVGTAGEGTEWAFNGSLSGARIGHPGSGVFATLADLLRFLLLFDPNGPETIHSAAGLRIMTTDQTNVVRIAPPMLSPEYPVLKWGAEFMIQGENGEVGLASPESYGHLGGTGCVGWIDPVHRVTVAFVSNSDAGRGWDEWRDRLEEAVNVAIAGATARG
jgi:CubicO group peptidase (beta-lactamase class C family)